MSVLSAQSIIAQHLISPCEGKTLFDGVSFGLGPAGYDIRLAEDVLLYPSGKVYLASAIEHFRLPADVIGFVADKSTWARRGLFVQNTVIEPGWRGYLTLELTYVGMALGRGFDQAIELKKGTGIAQVVFHWLDKPTDRPYNGKYQDQKQGAQTPIHEQSNTSKPEDVINEQPLPGERRPYDLPDDLLYHSRLRRMVMGMSEVANPGVMGPFKDGVSVPAEGFLHSPGQYTMNDCEQVIALDNKTDCKLPCRVCLNGPCKYPEKK